ncbi:MAG: RNA methyltransferase [Sulfurovum sp.]|nr:RNA methyltransferase [Sulfurovum sp.]
MQFKKDSQEFLEKKAFFDRLLTIYGRNATLEALKDNSIQIYRLHMTSSNKPAKVLTHIINYAANRGVEVLYHDKKSLSRISKNTKQDQGVALDIVMPYASGIDEFISLNSSYRIMALDGITNPQNLGMIIRSCAAGSIDAVLMPEKSNAQMSALVIKASAGTLFKIPIIKTKSLHSALITLKENNASLYILSADARRAYRDEKYDSKSVFILGNESSGVSLEVTELCDKSISIPMHRGVESLNVAVTAALLAFME